MEVKGKQKSFMMYLFSATNACCLKYKATTGTSNGLVRKFVQVTKVLINIWNNFSQGHGRFYYSKHKRIDFSLRCTVGYIKNNCDNNFRFYRYKLKLEIDKMPKWSNWLVKDKGPN